MIISFDGQPLLTENLAGIGTYTFNLIKHIVEADCDSKFMINVMNKMRGYPSRTHIEQLLTGNLTYSICNHPSNKITKGLELLLSCPYRFHFSEETDLTHFFNFILPAGVRGRKVITIHDMVYKKHPGTMRLQTRLLLESQLESSIKRADHIVTISTNSKNDIIEHFNVMPDKISIVYPAADRRFYNTAIDKIELNRCKTKYQIKTPYFLYVGTLEPRKNINRLIQAFADSRTRFSEDMSLVICGKPGWMYKDLFETVGKLDLSDQVIFTGYCPDEDVALLMKGALAFVFPSLYEGFGIPPLEAMSCGTPTITSITSSLPEVVGDAGLLVDPLSTEGIAEAMVKLQTNRCAREYYAIRGLEQSRKFSWVNSAVKTLELYKQILS